LTFPKPELTDKIAILKVETVQLIASLFRIHHVLIYNVCGALGIVRNTLTYLPKIWS
jgi:hypothetical protein